MDMKPPSAGKKSNVDFMTDLERLSNAIGDPIRFEVKVVVQTPEDLVYALYKVYPRCPTVFIIQPCVVDPINEISKLQELVESVLKYNLKNVRILPQLHKLIYPKAWRGK